MTSKNKKSRRTPGSISTGSKSQLQHVVIFLCVIAIALLALKIFSLLEEKKVLTPEYDTLTSGISQEMFTYDDKTLVVHDTPVIETIIITTDTCTGCADEAKDLAKKIKNALPTARISMEKKSADDLAASNISYVPSVVFSDTVTQTEFYTQGSSFFFPLADGAYLFDTGSLGHVPKEYSQSPIATKGFPQQEASTPTTKTVTATTDTQVNTTEIHAFLSTDCAQCATMHDVLSLVGARNADATIIYHFAQTHQESDHGASTALACATFLGKGDQYRTHLFARQSLWKAAVDKDAAFTSYATVWNIPQVDFAQCLESSEAEESTDTQNTLFAQFGISSVPTIFIGKSTTPLTGVQTVATIEKTLLAEKE